MHRLAKSIHRCRKEVPSELLVSIDSSSTGHREWAELVKNTSGYVVPVFSSNTQETGSYNRLASMARGKILVIIQVGIDLGNCIQCSVYATITSDSGEWR